MGKFDLVPKVLQAARRAGSVSPDCGSARQAHVVRHRTHGQAVFGLPGNPVSTLVCLIRYVIPAIAEAMGTKRALPERPGPGGARDLPASAHLFLAGGHRSRRLGPSLGQSAASQRIRAIF